MMLSAEQFQAVIQSLRVQDHRHAAASGPSALRARRVRLGGRTTVVPCGGEAPGVPFDAVARDVSPSGIALATPRRMLHGEKFILQLLPGCASDAPGDAAPLPLLCTVVRYQPTGDGLYVVGATFTRVLCAPPAAAPALKG